MSFGDDVADVTLNAPAHVFVNHDNSDVSSNGPTAQITTDCTVYLMLL